MKRIKPLIQAFLISLACTIQMQVPLQAINYEEKIDYLLAEVGVLLGDYSFLSVLLFIMALVLLRYTQRKLQPAKWQDYALTGFFAFWIYIGRSYMERGCWEYCFGSLVNFVRFALALIGMAILLQRVLGLLLYAYEELSRRDWKCRWSCFLFDKHCFWKVFALLMLLWLPVLLLSYPGNLCYDVIGQIEQVVGDTSYSAHHPLLHTLMVGGLTKLGQALFGSYEIGLFLYVLLQACMLASALAGTIWWLAKQEFAKGPVSHGILLLILGVYVFAPVYSNVASTALKDVPFVAMFIWYMILLTEVWQRRERLKQPGFGALFVLVQVLVCLLRNNGFYVILLTGLLLCLLWWKGADKKQRLSILLNLLVLPVVVSQLCSSALLAGLSAEKGKSAEIFSLPFQQTARYLQLYKQEVTLEESIAIRNVLADVDTVAANYDPNIADPVKALFYDHEEVTGRELLDYFVVWAQGFFKHPKVYVEAFLHHVYGWFDPEASNAIRYEASYYLIPREGLFTNADKILIFVYRFADKFVPTGLLQNVGAYTWAMLLLLVYALRKNRRAVPLLIPLLVSLLICMAAPCYYLHPRYAFPYMFTIPFLYGFMERSRE